MKLKQSMLLPCRLCIISWISFVLYHKLNIFCFDPKMCLAVTPLFGIFWQSRQRSKCCGCSFVYMLKKMILLKQTASQFSKFVITALLTHFRNKQQNYSTIISWQTPKNTERLIAFIYIYKHFNYLKSWMWETRLSRCSKDSLPNRGDSVPPNDSSEHNSCKMWK